MQGFESIVGPYFEELKIYSECGGCCWDVEVRIGFVGKD
jgi:hypothetical protein